MYCVFSMNSKIDKLIFQTKMNNLGKLKRKHFKVPKVDRTVQASGQFH